MVLGVLQPIQTLELNVFSVGFVAPTGMVGVDLSMGPHHSTSVMSERIHQMEDSAPITEIYNCT